jgi:hypothetical protein
MNNIRKLNLDLVPWFLPSLYGDIRLTAQGSKTEVEWEGLSPAERQALLVVGKKFDVVFDGDAGKVLIARPIDKIEGVLAKAMKRGRKLLSAVVFKNGHIEEMHRTSEAEPKDKGPKEGPYRDSAETDPYTLSAIVPAAAAAAAVAEPKAAVTVAQPTIGCPLPAFERADVRATRVLKAFLSDQQLADFERTQSFLVVGGDTGRKYILTSRQAPAERLDKVGGRSVFDVAAGEPICVHDWVVPAAEELLELKLFLELPRHEAYVRNSAGGVGVIELAIH